MRLVRDVNDVALPRVRRVKKRGALLQEANKIRSEATILNLFANLCTQIAAGPARESVNLNRICTFHEYVIL